MAISFGGDTDTIAAITGSLAEAHYGIPAHLITEVNNYLTNEQLEILKQTYKHTKIIKLNYINY